MIFVRNATVFRLIY